MVQAYSQDEDQAEEHGSESIRYRGKFWFGRAAAAERPSSLRDRVVRVSTTASRASTVITTLAVRIVRGCRRVSRLRCVLLLAPFLVLAFLFGFARLLCCNYVYYLWLFGLGASSRNMAGLIAVPTRPSVSRRLRSRLIIRAIRAPVPVRLRRLIGLVTLIARTGRLLCG